MTLRKTSWAVACRNLIDRDGRILKGFLSWYAALEPKPCKGGETDCFWWGASQWRAFPAEVKSVFIRCDGKMKGKLAIHMAKIYTEKAFFYVAFNV